MNYTETFITEPSVEELYNSAEEEALYFNDEWLDEDDDFGMLSEMFGDYEPDDEFFAYVDDMEYEDDGDDYDEDYGDDYIEVGFDPYMGCYSYDC